MYDLAPSRKTGITKLPNTKNPKYQMVEDYLCRFLQYFRSCLLILFQSSGVDSVSGDRIRDLELWRGLLASCRLCR